MYSTGPIVDIDINELKTREYRCLECGDTFKGLGKNLICPYCQSNNIIFI